jgi:hypothetical protein
MDAGDKVREARLRRMAERQGLHLQKSRRRDRLAIDYEGYQLVEAASNLLVFGQVAGRRFGASLDDVEDYLSRPHADRRADRPVTNGQGNAGVVVDQVPVPEWASDLLLGRQDQADLVVLPPRVKDGRGEYGMDDLVAVKALRAAGIRADWAHVKPEDRLFTSEYSADVVVFVVLFVAQSLAQEGVVEVARWLLARVRDALSGRSDGKTAAPIVVQVDRLKLDGQRRVIEGLRITGHDERVVEVVTALLQGGPVPK